MGRGIEQDDPEAIQRVGDAGDSSLVAIAVRAEIFTIPRW